LIVRSNVGSADSANFSLKGETSASFANADLDQSATQVIFSADKSGFIFQIRASGAAVQASHPATIKLTHYRDFRLDV
jgi:hypothetical protein